MIDATWCMARLSLMQQNSIDVSTSTTGFLVVKYIFCLNEVPVDDPPLFFFFLYLLSNTNESHV
jgi:hypothetical protein